MTRKRKKKKADRWSSAEASGKDVPPRWADSNPTTCKATSKPNTGMTAPVQAGACTRVTDKGEAWME